MSEGGGGTGRRVEVSGQERGERWEAGGQRGPGEGAGKRTPALFSLLYLLVLALWRESACNRSTQINRSGLS